MHPYIVLIVQKVWSFITPLHFVSVTITSIMKKYLSSRNIMLYLCTIETSHNLLYIVFRYCPVF